MGFKNKAFATVWSVEPGTGNFMKVRLSINRRSATGEWISEFSGYCMFAGTARAKAEHLRPKDRIQLTDVDVSTSYDKAKQKEYVNFKVFDFEPAAPVPAASAPAAVDHNPVQTDDDAPF